MLTTPKLIVRLSVAALAACSAACSAVSFLAANIPASFGAYQRTSDVAYGKGQRQRLDIYMPEHANTHRPVVVFWYGGSWTSGSRSEYRFVGAALAERGFVVIVPDYRLYPQVRFPTFMDDAAQALAWVQLHASEYGGDPQHIFLMGHSAGAHIAAYLAYNRDFLRKSNIDPSSIAGFIGLSGPYVLVPNTRTLNRIFAKPYTPAQWQPIQFVSHESPPTFLAHGLSDSLVSPAQTEKLRDALRANNVRVEAQLYPRRHHADTIAALSIPARRRAPVLDQVSQFIDSLAGPVSAEQGHGTAKRAAQAH